MENQQSLFSRSDTLLGVCEALGEDFGFNPLYLRVSLAVLVIWSPVVALAAYGFAAVAVLLSRLIFPMRVARAAETDEAVGDLATPSIAPAAQARTDAGMLPIAA